MNPICLCLNFECKLKTCGWCTLDILLLGKIQKKKKRKENVTCVCQAWPCCVRDSTVRRRIRKACVRKIKGDDERLKGKRRKKETETVQLNENEQGREEGRKEGERRREMEKWGERERRETGRWLMEPKSRFLASSDLHYSAISRHIHIHTAHTHTYTHTHLAINAHTHPQRLSHRLLACNQHTGYWSAAVINSIHAAYV